MPLHDGATTEELLAEGYTVAPRGRWMRLDSSWMAICESCGRWYSELPDRHFCSRCHAELYHGDSPDLPSLHPLACQGTFGRMLFFLALTAIMVGVAAATAMIK
jgi:hypothetical protein